MHFTLAVILGLGISASFVVSSPHIDSQSNADDSTNLEPLILYVADQERGILTLQFDPSKPAQSSLSVLATTYGGFMPGWLTTHNDKIYTVSRTQFPTVNSTSGGVFSFKPHDGQARSCAKGFGLTLLSNASSEGLGSVACDVSRDGRTIAVANM